MQMLLTSWPPLCLPRRQPIPRRPPLQKNCVRNNGPSSRKSRSSSLRDFRLIRTGKYLAIVPQLAMGRKTRRRRDISTIRFVCPLFALAGLSLEFLNRFDLVFVAQVVSTRGEKFTFVKTEADVEMEKRMEKTYVQLGTLYTKGKRGA